VKGWPLPAIENGGSSKTTAIVGWATASGGRLPNVKTSLEPDVVRSSDALTSVSLASRPGAGRTQAAADGPAGLDGGIGVVEDDGCVVALAGGGLEDAAGRAADADGAIEPVPVAAHPTRTTSELSPSAS
jgi:hypothetical protein